ncbi:MAG TPA: TonB-dependent receptor [Pyrinomonadaceae bacterium]
MNSLIRVIVTLLCSTLSLALSVTVAQSLKTVTGTITDQSGAVVANAEVSILNLASGRQLNTKTDSSGEYQLKGLPSGSYRLSINGHGFAVAERVITLQRTASYREDFSLVPGVIESNVTVTAGRGNARVAVNTPQIVSVTTRSDVEADRPQSAARAIERTSNLIPVIANPALERPRLRGLASNRVLVLLDGERLNNMRSDPTSGVSPSVVAVTQIESAEVLSGAGSSLYGSDAMAGVINLITAAPPADTGRLGLLSDGYFYSNSSFRRGTTTINWSRPKLAIRLGGSLFRQTNYHSGNQSISVDQVVALGQLVTNMGNAVGNSVARTYAVWSLPAGAAVANGQGHGFNDQIDVWVFPSDKQSFHYRQLNSQDKDLGFSFIATPFDPRTQLNSFRRLDKYGLRYERREMTRWLPRIAAGFYGQKYSFPDVTTTSPILLGSSWTLAPDPNDPTNLLSVLTGNRSSFTAGNLSESKSSITTHALDVQATFAPAVRTLITTGVGYLRDYSVDEFSRIDLAPPVKAVSGRASNPDSIYRNWNWFGLFEHDANRWLRLTAGLRVDNWRTEARVTKGFPIGVESTLLDLSFAGLVANPGPINTQGAAGITDLIKGVKGITTSRTVVTGNAGAVVRLPQGINLYFRWGNSYREPGVTERYLLRDFGDPTFSVLVIPNTGLKPERGREFDAGLKLQRAKWNASVGFFRNDLKDFIGSAFGPPLFVPADPDNGLAPISPFFPFHGVLYVQRTNTARARIQGFESSYEVSLPLGHLGVVTPFGSLGLLKGSNLAPDEGALKLLAQFYNRADTPIPLRGSARDVPLSSITPLRTINGVRFDNANRSWFAEYENRYQARVKRADPLDLSAAISTEYGTVASLNSFAVHSLRGGYAVRREGYRMLFTIGVQNLTNRFYFEHFQTAPAPGRSFVFGTTLEIFNLLQK